VPAHAEKKFAPVAPFLDDRTVAVLHVDLTGIDLDALVARVAGLAQVATKDLDTPRKELGPWLRNLTTAGARDLYVIASLIDLPEQPPFVVVPLEKGADARAIQAELRRSKICKDLRFEVIGDAIVGGAAATRNRLRSLKAVARPELAEALAGSGGGVAQLVLATTPDTRKVFEEVMPTLPPEIGGGSIKIVTRGLRWGAVNVELQPLRARLTLQATDETTARELSNLLVQTAKVLAQQKVVREWVHDIEKIAALVKPQVAGTRVTLVWKEADLAVVLTPFVQHLRDEAARERYGAHLRQILVAMHEYEVAHARFPAAALHDKQGRPLLSWRVALLPYLGEDNLYKQFHLDEPWDSEHNKKLIARMPAVYRTAANPKLAREGKTTYLAPRGEETMFPGTRGVRIFEVTDGTANTIFLVDADDEHAVVWTRPEDLKYNPKDPARGLSARHPDGFLTGFVDGSIHFLPRNMDKMNLHALFTRQGGEVVAVP
jgi:hypothetical protein